MDLRFSEDEEAFRLEVHQFLVDELPEWWFNQQGESDELWEVGRRFARKLAARGWLVKAWPREWGGQELPVWKQIVFAEEMAVHQAPQDGMGLGVGLIGPLIMQVGSEEQKKRHLPGIASGEVVWAECFSEPDTGSDLAGLQLKAELDGDTWRLDGEKIWISHGYKSDWAIVLARSEPDLPKHKGISMFLVDFKSPGLSARRLNHLVGSEYLSEVHFDRVRVPASGLLGERGRGFYYAMSTVGVERAVATKYASGLHLLRKLVRYAASVPRDGRPILEDPVLLNRIAGLAAELEISKLMSYQGSDRVRRGEAGPEVSMAFAWDTQVQQRLQDLAMDVVGDEGRLLPGCEWAPLRGLLASRDFRTIHATVAPGTLEIQKMVVATRYLGLPR